MASLAVAAPTTRSDFYPGAIWAPGSDFGFPVQGDHGRMGYPVRYVVVHGTGSPGYPLDYWIQNAHARGGVHFMIGKDGRVVQFLRISDASWGNGIFDPGHAKYWDTWKQPDGRTLNPNLTSVSIEHEKLTKHNTEPLTPAQQAASFKLIAWLCREWGIPPRAANATGGIAPHSSIQPIGRWFCPGPYPWTALYAYLAQGGIVSTPTPTSTLTATHVHRVLDNFESISEFPDEPGINKFPAIRVACEVAAQMAVTHSLFGTPMTPAYLVQLYDDMMKHGDMGRGGAVPDGAESYIRTVLKYQTLYPAAWHWHDGTDQSAIHSALIEGAGINGYIMEVNHAAALPFNEGGVNSHYIAIGGIDSVLGYLIGNGDDILALAQHNGHGKTFAARWMTWAQLSAAVPTSLIGIVHPTKPSAVAVPTGWDDTGTQLIAPNKHYFEKGFRQQVLALGSAWNPQDMPEMEEVGDADGSFIQTRDHEMEWTLSGGVVVRPKSVAARFYLSVEAKLAATPAPDPNAAEEQKALAAITQIKTLVAPFN